MHPFAVAVQSGHREPRLGLAAEGDDGDRVVAAQPVGHQVQGLADQVEATGLGHRTGDVDDEGEGGGRAPVVAEAGPGGEADAHQGPVRGVRAGAVDGDGEAVAVRLPVVLAEAVDELLRAHGPGVREIAVGEGPAGVAPARGVHVEGEGGEVVRGRCLGAAAVVLALRLSVGPVGGAGRALGGGRGGVAAAAPPAALLGGAATAVVAAVGGTAPGEQHRCGGEYGEHGRSRRPAVVVSASVSVSVSVADGCARRHGVPLRTGSVWECDVREGELEPTGVLRTRLERTTAGGTSSSGGDQDTMVSRRATPDERRAVPVCPSRGVCLILYSGPGHRPTGLALVVQGKTPHFPWGNAGARPAQRSIKAPASSRRPGPLPYTLPRRVLRGTRSGICGSAAERVGSLSILPGNSAGQHRPGGTRCALTEFVGWRQLLRCPA